MTDTIRKAVELAEGWIFHAGQIISTPFDSDVWTIDNLEQCHLDALAAQLRHLRKERFGAHTIDRKHMGKGLYRYRLIITPTQERLF